MRKCAGHQAAPLKCMKGDGAYRKAQIHGLRRRFSGVQMALLQFVFLIFFFKGKRRKPAPHKAFFGVLAPLPC